ncbi:hypothetical protein [Streptomyces anandii]|uniref:hypothetical protein n=1 Tax=Streptomyces anandii TaxID=285454 RepID=UPI00167C09C3|nr:hypothetical protein [Streptomyces anandii]GGX80315.1 hypothetical protein GCM10010510_26440 [Streptomyces anandii JCM 4720]
MGTTAGPAMRWGLALGLGAVWWWAVLRLVLSDDAGLLEGAVAAGGWGLSLLPVHCVPEAVAREDRSGKRSPVESPPPSSERPEPVVPSEPVVSEPVERSGSVLPSEPVEPGRTPEPVDPSGRPVGPVEPSVPSDPVRLDESGGWPYGGSGGAGEALSPDSGGWPFGATRASRHRRSDGGSDPS